MRLGGGLRSPSSLVSVSDAADAGGITDSTDIVHSSIRHLNRRTLYWQLAAAVAYFVFSPARRY